MFKSLDSIASVVGIFMYLTISKFKQVLRSRKGLDYNTALNIHCINHNSLDNKGNCWILKDFYCSVTMLRELGLSHAIPAVNPPMTATVKISQC